MIFDWDELVIPDKFILTDYQMLKSSTTTNTADKIKLTRDRPIKSIVKAITWRIIASGTTFFLAVLFFGSDPKAIQKATGVALIESILKIVLYFLHERAYAQLRWGRMLVIIRRNTRRSRRSIQRIILKRA
jgi:uncharacterized membrane protein